jgi:hypothetical protein
VPKREVDRSSQSSAEVKNAWSYTPNSIPPEVLMAYCYFGGRGFEINYEVVFELQAKRQTNNRKQIMM